MTRTSTRGRSGTSAYVDGANALKIDYAEPIPRRRRPPAPRNSPVSAAPAPAAPEESPAAAPLPVALPRASFVILMLTLVVAGVLGVLLLNTQINEDAFRLDHLRSQQSDLDLKEQQARQKLAERSSTGNLAADAERAGLVPAASPTFINLNTGQVVDPSGAGR
jgi:hypothetical protein